MFNKIYTSQSNIKKHMNSPLFNERVEYIKSLIKNRKSMKTIRNSADFMIKIINYLYLNKRRVLTLEEIEKAANKFSLRRTRKKHIGIDFSQNRKNAFWFIAKNFLTHCNLLQLDQNNETKFFNRIFKKRYPLQRHACASLAKERIQYLQYWSDHGATVRSLQDISRHLLIVMKHLNFYKLRKVSITEIERSTKYLKKMYRTNYRKKKYIKSASVGFIHDATHWLDMIGCLKKNKIKKVSLDEKHLNKYINYMRVEQGLSESTIASRFSNLSEFISIIYKKNKKLKNISPVDIDSVFIKKSNVDGYSRNTVQTYASVVRSFIKYAENKKWCKKNLYASIKSPRTYDNESIPYGPDWGDVKKLLRNSNTKKPSGIRDHAILMLLAIYGMRRGEVASLRLDDIDWENECIYLRRVKRSKPQIFPLSKPVGNAILRYIKEVRRNDRPYREIFLNLRLPYENLKSGAIYRIVSERLKPLNPKIKHFGPHALRHACATHLINTGFSLKEISDHLGHNELDTTRIYTKVDIVNLRKVSEFNFGDLLL